MQKIFLLTLWSLVPLQEGMAIPPPDIIISGMQSVVQVFGVAVAFLVSAFFLLKDTLKLWWQLHRKKLMIGGGLLLSMLLLGSVYFLANW